ncbi:hypothetical protein JCM10213v2_003644 [Rhodosporidiobolus nylandii]
MDGPTPNTEGAKQMLQWVLKRVERDEEVRDMREMKLLLKGMTQLGEVMRLLKE